MLELKNLGKKLGQQWIFRNLNLEVGTGIQVLIGPNGCGKSTLLKTIAGFYSPDEGEVWLNGRDLFSIPLPQRRVGYIPQSRALFAHLTVEQNIFYSGQPPDSWSDQLIEVFQLRERMALYPGQLSRGFQSRVALVRALVARPKILLADEPLSDTDAEAKVHFLNLLKNWLADLKIPVIWVTHDQLEETQFRDATHKTFHNLSSRL